MTKYKYLLMDSDLTLLDFDAEAAVAIEKAYRHMGLDAQKPFSTEMTRLYERCNNRWWAKLENDPPECTKDELFIGRFVDFLSEAGIIGDPVLFNKIYFDYLEQGGQALPGALDAVKNLAKSHEIYIVTNGYKQSAAPRLIHAGFGEYIKKVFVSEDIGFAKPHKGYFDYVMGHIQGFDKASAIVIGDSLVSDMAGASAAGLDSLWFNRLGKENPKAVPFTYEARTYEEMLDILM